MAAQYAYVMKDMTKSFPGAQKPVLSHINLQFYHGAKIGIVGPNGAGKSTLMKIMAGIDTDYHRRGLAGREHHRRLSAAGAAARPEQDRARERQGRRARGRRHGRPVQRHLGRDGRPEGRRRLRRADGGDGRAPGEDRRGRRLDARQPARDRDGGAALPAGRLGGRKPVGRREAPHRADPAADPEARRSCCSTSRPTTSTPRASNGSKTTSRNMPARC